jgi:hypothetical protein
MSQPGGSFEWEPGPQGIVEGLIGAGIGFILLPAVNLGWQLLFHQETPEDSSRQVRENVLPGLHSRKEISV